MGITLIERLHRPYTYLFPFDNFPTTIAVLDRNGSVVAGVADGALQQGLPSGGVGTGPRDVGWTLGAPATVEWTEALDKGDPRVEAAQRDRIVMRAMPAGEPVKLLAVRNNASSA